MPTHGSSRHEEPQAELIARAAAVASTRRGSGGPPRDTVESYLRQYYRHVAVEDLTERADVDLYGAAVSQYSVASERPQGTANVRVFTPTVDEHGWSAGGHTVVEVVTDDMSFLVDSVTMALNDEGRNVHMVVHPQLLVRRDVTGHLVEVRDDEGYQVGQEGAEPDVGSRVVDARRDRPRGRERRADGDRAAAAQGAARRARVRGGLGPHAAAGQRGRRAAA